MILEKNKGMRKEKTDRDPDLVGLRSRSQVMDSQKHTGQVGSWVRGSQKNAGQVGSWVRGSPRPKTLPVTY